MESPNTGNILQLEEKGFSSIPQTVNTQLSAGKITQVLLAGQSFRDIPPEITDCSNIKVLDLTEQRIQDPVGKECFDDSKGNFQVNPEIGRMTSLLELYLAGNALSSLPESLTNLRYLTTLDLKSNLLDTIPPCILGLHQLRRLQLCQNCITHIPVQIKNLRELAELSLEHNRLLIVPDEVSDLMKLKILTLRGNDLLYIPDFLRDSDRYEHISFDDDLQLGQRFDAVELKSSSKNHSIKSSNETKHQNGKLLFLLSLNTIA